MGNKYIYQNVKVGRAGVSFKINGTAKSNSVPLSNENRTFGIALNIYYNNSSTPEFHYQNFSADTDSYQQVSLSVTPEKTNEVVNYIAFAFVYGYNENEMTVDNAEVNISPLIQSSEDSKNETSEKEAVDEEVLSESIDKSKPYMQTSSEYDSTGNYVTSETNEQGSTTQHAYDANGNITEIKQNGKLTNKYVYDSLNELKEEYDYVNKFYINYSYDGAGNLQNKYEQALDPNYGYPTGTQNGNTYEYTDTSWKDKLTKINGDNITYDANGNPLTYRDGMSMTWKNGRQLATLTNGDTSISYGYDSDSVRTTKTVNGVKYTYAYLNGQLLYETRGDAKFYYSYDANGILYNVRYTLTDGGTEYSYYYTHNSRGDIVGIYNGVGELKAHYEYDAWGNVISITDNNGNAITNPNHIGNLNPFRYRGYYQDTETGLYYLMSRYYDPITHRFINADGYFQSGTSILDANTFAYCGNNPVLNVDPLGTCKVPNYTSAGTYIGHTWKIKESVPGVPGFCNVCKGYGSNAPSNTSHSFVISSYTTPSTKKQDYNTWNKVADSFGAIFCSLEVDFDAGFGFGFDVTDIFSIKAMGKHTLISVHFDEQGFSFGKTDSVEVSAGVCGWDLFGVQDTKFYENGSGNEYENFGSSHKIGFSKGDYVGVGATIGFGWNLDYIYNRFCEIWG